MKRRMAGIAAGGCLLACVALAGAGAAGPGDAPPPRREQAERTEGRPDSRPWDRGAARARLGASIEELRRMEVGIQAAIERLERGEDVAAVMADVERLRASMRPGFLFTGARGQGDAEAPRPLTDEERTRLVRFMEEYLPRMAARMKELAERDRPGHDRLLQRMSSRLVEAESMRELEPKRFRLKIAELAASSDVVEAGRQIMELSRTPGQNREAMASAEARLRTAVMARFDAHMALQADEVATLGSRMERLQREFEALKASRDDRIDDECQRMLQRLRHQGDGPPARRPGQRGPGTRPDDDGNN